MRRTVEAMGPMERARLWEDPNAQAWLWEDSCTDVLHEVTVALQIMQTDRLNETYGPRIDKGGPLRPLRVVEEEEVTKEEEEELLR